MVFTVAEKLNMCAPAARGKRLVQYRRGWLPMGNGHRLVHGIGGQEAHRVASSTTQVSLPPNTAPVSMAMRLWRTTGTFTGVWPCTTTAPKSASE